MRCVYIKFWSPRVKRYIWICSLKYFSKFETCTWCLVYLATCSRHLKDVSIANIEKQSNMYLLTYYKCHLNRSFYYWRGNDLSVILWPEGCYWKITTCDNCTIFCDVCTSWSQVKDFWFVMTENRGHALPTKTRVRLCVRQDQ